MKTYLVLITISVLFLTNSCKKNDSSPVDVESLVIGKWKLTESKQDNQAWKDSSGITYSYVDDTLVNTAIGTFSCNRRYKLESSTEGLKRVRMFPNYACSFSDWNSFSIVSITNTKMEITYPDEIGGVLVRFNERYVKE